MQPAPAVARAVQVEAVQPEGAAEEGEPGRDRLGALRAVAAHAVGPAVASPGPRAFCMITTSSQRSNFQPAERIVPAGAKPSARCTPIERGVGRIADHRQHLPCAGGLAAGEELGQEQPPEPPAGALRCQVDRVLEAEAIGRPRSERTGVGITGDGAGAFEHQPGQALGEHVGPAALDLEPVRRLDLEGARAIQHVPGVDAGDGVDVGRGARPDHDSAHGNGR